MAALRNTLGMLLQVVGLLLLPVAVIQGMQQGDLYQELLLFGMGVGAFLVGRALRVSE